MTSVKIIQIKILQVKVKDITQVEYYNLYKKEYYTNTCSKKELKNLTIARKTSTLIAIAYVKTLFFINKF